MALDSLGDQSSLESARKGAQDRTLVRKFDILMFDKRPKNAEPKMNVEFSHQRLFCKSKMMCFHFVSPSISNVLSRAPILADSNEL